MTIVRCVTCNSPFAYFHVRPAHPDQYKTLKKLMGKKLSTDFKEDHTNRVLIMTPNQDYRPNETVIGCIEIIALPNNSAYLSRLVVKSAFRHNGLGLRLIDEALNYCAEHKLTAIYALTKQGIPLGKYGWIKTSSRIFDMYVPRTVFARCANAPCDYWARVIIPKKEE